VARIAHHQLQSELTTLQASFWHQAVAGINAVAVAARSGRCHVAARAVRGIASIYDDPLRSMTIR